MSGLRVIAGSAKGLKLRRVPGDVVRPIGDRVKEALFNIIGHEIVNSTFLDLFAGTGSVGIEALSRGAGGAVFVDNNRRSIETIRENLEHTRLISKAKVLHTDVLSLLAKGVFQSFDYVYVAPPQYRGLWSLALAKIDRNPEWLNPDAWVVVQIHPREFTEESLVRLSEFDRRKYGSTVLVFYEYLVD